MARMRLSLEGRGSKPFSELRELGQSLTDIRTIVFAAAGCLISISHAKRVRKEIC